MNLGWALNRLRAMSPREILHRLGERGRQKAAKGRLEGWDRYSMPGPAPQIEQLAALARRLAAERADACATDMENILNGRFSALGQSWPMRDSAESFPSDLWRLDPLTGAFWPGSTHYCFDIPYRHERTRGDIKYVWEINRLQFLQPLAAKVAQDGDARALGAIEAAIQSWYHANPPFRGVAWNSGIEIALRSISLLVVSSLVATSLSQGTTDHLRSILVASLFWMRRYPSRFSSANNHLIAEAVAEYLIAIAMPDLPGAAKTVDEARGTLDTEVEKQFFIDGVPSEQSPTYGAFSSELVLVAHQVMPLAPRTLARLQQFSEFIGWLADQRGRVPSIGDDDEGVVIGIGARRETYALDVATQIAATAPRDGLKVFAEGGYSVLRQEDWHLVFDHGPLGYLSIAAHGHADALSVTLAYKGRPILVDPGTYLYHSGVEWRDWFRGTAAHNTLSLGGGANQSNISGPFNWSEKAQARLESAEVVGKSWRLTASHDGYLASFGLRHRRSISGKAATIVISDELSGARASAEAHVTFQFAPGLTIDVANDSCRVSDAAQPIALFRFCPPGRLATFSGALPGDGGGWVSTAFGTKVPASRLVWSGEIGPVGLTTTIEASERIT